MITAQRDYQANAQTIKTARPDHADDRQPEVNSDMNRFVRCRPGGDGAPGSLQGRRCSRALLRTKRAWRNTQWIRLIYLSMAGAKATMQRQDTLANNLANVSTVGFRAELSAFRARCRCRADGASTRVYSLESTPGYDASPGTVTRRPAATSTSP